MRRGAVGDSALILLAERELHGYEIIAELEDRSRGRWRPSPGSIYPALGRLENKGLIVGTETDGGKRRYALTDEGRAWNDRRDPDAPLPWDEVADRRDGGDLRAAMAELAGQARQIGRFGTDAQRAAAVDALSETRTRLYRILADTDAAGSENDNDSDGDGDAPD